MEPKWCQHGAKNLPKWGRSDGVPPPSGSRWRKSKKKQRAQQKRGLLPTASPILAEILPQLSSQNGAKMAKTSMQKSVVFLMHLGNCFFQNCCGFWVAKQNGTKLAPKWNQKSISQKTRKNAFGASPLVPNCFQGVQVGSENRSKIDPKMESKMGCIMAPILFRFWWFLGAKLGWKIHQNQFKKVSKKRCKTHQNRITETQPSLSGLSPTQPKTYPPFWTLPLLRRVAGCPRQYL